MKWHRKCNSVIVKQLISTYTITLVHSFTVSAILSTMHSIPRVLAILTILLAPAFASAAEQTVWDFKNEQVPGDWTVTKLSATPTPQGLAISATERGKMNRENTWHNSIQMVEVTYMSVSQVQSWFMFQLADKKDLFGVPMVFNQSDTQQKILIPASTFKQWNPRPNQIGFAFDPGAQVLIQEIKLIHLTPFERLAESWKTFWTLDDFSGHSVNFVWAPLITDTPAGREHMHANSELMPQAESSNKYFYILLLASAIILFILAIIKKITRRHAVLIFSVIFAVCWLFYDIRMGSEFINYLANDYETYWSKPVNERIFRERTKFNAFASVAAPYLEEQEEYVFIPDQKEFVNFMRYITYPAIPINQIDEEKIPKYWAFYGRPDIEITGRGSGQLIMDNQVITPPGKIVEQFYDGIFLFEVSQ